MPVSTHLFDIAQNACLPRLDDKVSERSCECPSQDINPTRRNTCKPSNGQKKKKVLLFSETKISSKQLLTVYITTFWQRVYRRGSQNLFSNHQTNTSRKTQVQHWRTMAVYFTFCERATKTSCSRSLASVCSSERCIRKWSFSETSICALKSTQEHRTIQRL